MKLCAYSKSVKDILTLQRKYVIPRYQREYSWDIEQVEEFWKDITEQFDYEKEIFNTRDYFIGSFVLVGDDVKDTEFMIVDGQQRLTTITILLAALTHIGYGINNDDFANSCYQYIEGKDPDYQNYFYLENESPKPFFQKAIQYKKNDIELKFNTTEEFKLFNAYKFFKENILSKKDSISEFLLFLKAIRDQIISCSTIYITVEDKEDAQTIFETLNAKGKDLSTLDLIKNKIFEVLDESHPSDYAKESWIKLKSILNSRANIVSLDVFFRHFWIANYTFATESKIYNLFQNKIPKNKSSYEIFLKNLLAFAENYIKIISPNVTDFNEEINIYSSLRAIIDFRVKQPHPLLTTLLGYYKEKLINLNQLVKIVKQIEIFHFMFSAITSSRASGLESMYSKRSQELKRTKDKREIKIILDSISEHLFHKVSDIPYENFEKKFIELKYSNTFTKDKKLIQYIFKTYEKILLTTDELSVNKFTIEHIQSQKIDTEWSHNIGNLLPLDKELNNECKDDQLIKKIKIFNRSELQQVKEFCRFYQFNKDWSENDVIDRSKKLSESIYKYCMNVLKNDD